MCDQRFVERDVITKFATFRRPLPFIRQKKLPTHVVAPGAKKGSYAIIRTQPLPPSALVTTRPFPADQLVASIEMNHIVETSSASRLYRDFNDDELLVMLSPKVAALVRLGPDKEKLIVLDQTRQKTVPQN